jgi:NAD(P) transhydrogenase subunit beta
MSPDLIENLTQGSYLVASALFIFSLRWLSRPDTARRGVLAGVLGMTLAVVGTLLHPEVVHFEWIAIAVVALVWKIFFSGSLMGAPCRCCRD